MDKTRLDKWLWAARFYKTRSLAVDEINKGRVLVNGQSSKPARDIQVGDEISITKQPPATVVIVQAISAVRGPATVARTLYAETPESIHARESAAEQRRLAPEPALSIHAGRPTKRDRRNIDRLKHDDY
jgi:ribosome-associated heat shock protein Hsp15